MSDFDVFARGMKPWEEIDPETVELSDSPGASDATPAASGQRPLVIDWADENRAWLQLRDAGLLADGVTPRHLREARDEVEKQREAEEFAERWAAAYDGRPYEPKPSKVEFATPNETPAERQQREREEFAEACERQWRGEPAPERPRR